MAEATQQAAKVPTKPYRLVGGNLMQGKVVKSRGSVVELTEAEAKKLPKKYLADPKVKWPPEPSTKAKTRGLTNNQLPPRAFDDPLREDDDEDDAS